jgi:hypothetical protein
MGKFTAIVSNQEALFCDDGRDFFLALIVRLNSMMKKKKIEIAVRRFPERNQRRKVLFDTVLYIKLADGINFEIFFSCVFLFDVFQIRQHICSCHSIFSHVVCASI